MTATATAPALDLASFDHALAAAVAKASPSIVHVDRARSGGTGIAWSEDLVISSSFHTPDETTIHTGPERAADGPGEAGNVGVRERHAVVIGRDPGTDIALLRVEGGGLTPATFRELGGLSVGNLALALGRPGRSVRASLRGIGVIGTDVRTAWGGKLEHYVESDRQIPKGFAGGPLVDAAGDVIGMSSRTLIRGADLAITTVTLRRVVTELLAHGGIRRGYLGVGAVGGQIPTAIAATLGRERGALIASLEDGGPGAAGGLLVGDLLVDLEGAPITGPDSLRTVLADRAGQSAKLTLIRGGVQQELTVTIGTRS